ncbi:polysaccharide deacetylase family protein [Arthrobacter sp. SD76]|uniref:polysaccharide deacetylase family protein n=1 Tax=Arthrobacter sp. SD76 TaxID=3415007 RepID=UPI003C70BD23
MPLQLPPGKRLAFNIQPHFDAQSAWQGTFKLESPAYLARGEFDAEVGVPRVLALLEKYDIKGTFFTPTHTMATFPAQFEKVLAAGHEIGAHGCYHEHIPSMDPDTEARLMELTIAQHEKYVGKRPRGFGSPAWDFSSTTFELLLKWGFTYDSSLMGRDFQPYFPRKISLDLENGNTFGEPWGILEIPVSWYLDDFPHLEFISGVVHGPSSIDDLVKGWTTQFDYAYEHEEGGVFTLTVHPGTIGRAHHIVAFEKFLAHVREREGVWIATLGEIADTWVN